MDLTDLLCFRRRTRVRKNILCVLWLDARNTYALTNLAQHLTGEPTRAMALLVHALSINPNLFYARPSIAHLHLSMGQFPEARDMLAEHLRHRPDDVDAGTRMKNCVTFLALGPS